MEKRIAFIDLEVQPQSRMVLDYGGVRWDGRTLHSGSSRDARSFLDGVEYLCGHNLFRHDRLFLKDLLEEKGITGERCIDTLMLSPILFPRKPYHALLKDEKLQTGELNNPLTDALKARDLFFDEVNAFQHLPEPIRRILYLLLENREDFCGFFDCLGYRTEGRIEPLILAEYGGAICSHANLGELVRENPVELAYCLSNIGTGDRFSILPRWVQMNYPDVGRVMTILRNRPCVEGCSYCERVLDPHRGLKQYFGFDSFRTFGGRPLQEQAVRTALEGRSLLAIFPTGAGKSLTFQIPALVSGEAAKGLTVVISPLQSLMKDQVDNLEKAGITEAVTINGLVDPIERSVAIQRVEDGSASILYISPESLRSWTIHRLLTGRRIERFVIDEAHCFSAWGQDFRVDYLYIGRFIRELEKRKQLTDRIPISCFTATAKPSVVEDIISYFREQLDMDLKIIRTDVPRKNLHFSVREYMKEDDKYHDLRLLTEARGCPAIVYVSRTRKAEELAARLTGDGQPALFYHGKMEPRQKAFTQEAFISGEADIMVATSAFGMGVDKKDVGLVVHYDISDSLENYVQEAGRAGRDESVQAECVVFFCQEDLDNHFALLISGMLTIKEIQQVWKAIKDLTRFRMNVSQSALEIARTAGWDENVAQVETRVKAALAALEDAGYLLREQNSPRVYADSILAKSGEEAYKKIRSSSVFGRDSAEQAVRIMTMLIGSRSRSRAKDQEGECRVDYISEKLAIPREDVVHLLDQLRGIGLLGDSKDLTAYIASGDRENKSLQKFERYTLLERFLLTLVTEEESEYNLKSLNMLAGEAGCPQVSPDMIRTILNYWKLRKYIRYGNAGRDHIRLICCRPVWELKEVSKRREELAGFVIRYLFGLSDIRTGITDRMETMISFSLVEVMEAYNQGQLFDQATLEELEDVLFYLSRIGAVRIEGGFMVIYNSLVIRRVEDARKRYKKEDYLKMYQHYEQRIQQIHIVGEYARIMVEDYRKALKFVEDYFQLEYRGFLDRYFPGRRKEEISRRISPRKFREIFGDLSPAQLRIIQDSDSQYIGVLAGPGSGKTRVLVHKLAAMFLMEDVKTDQLLMLTFSRAAATEFRLRLGRLIGKAAQFVEIKTFHSYCFDLLGQVGDLEHTENVMTRAVEWIIAGEVEPSRITKAVLVIDEAQDMDPESFSLVRTLMDRNEDMRVLAVGDDDQNIFEFRGSSSRYLQQFLRETGATVHELLTNYRSRRNIVEFANRFAVRIPGRLKSRPAVSSTEENGQIRVVRHYGEEMIVPFVENIIKNRSAGSYCVLTCTNNEALQVAGLLLKRGLKARLIQSNDGFRLMDMVEFRSFADFLQREGAQGLIDGEQWEQGKRYLETRFSRSIRLENCRRFIRSFEAIHPEHKYLSDFLVTLRESGLEDFYFRSSDSIAVSTIHKAKGKEFDHVHLLLQNYRMNTGEDFRRVYVAVTRAKATLEVHLNSDCLEAIRVEGMEYQRDHTQHPLPGLIAMQAGLRDVHLDYFIDRQAAVRALQSGDPLTYEGGNCLDSLGRSVLRFSRKFMAYVEKATALGYTPREARVSFMVHWHKEGEDQEHIVILPELYLERESEEMDLEIDSSRLPAEITAGGSI